MSHVGATRVRMKRVVRGRWRVRVEQVAAIRKWRGAVLDGEPAFIPHSVPVFPPFTGRPRGTASVGEMK